MTPLIPVFQESCYPTMICTVIICLKKFAPYLFLISILIATQSALAESVETSAANMDVFYSYCLQIDPVGAKAGKAAMPNTYAGVSVQTIRQSQRYKDEYQKAKTKMSADLKELDAMGMTLAKSCEYFGVSSVTVDLRSAADEGDVVNVKRLIAAGADLNASDAYGYRAIHFAARKQGEQGAEIVRLLIAAGAKVDWVDSEGSTPIYAAAEAGNVEAIEALLAAGANPNTPNKRGWLPIERALNYPGFSKAVKALIRGGANVNLPDSFGDPLVSRVVMVGDDVDLLNDFLKAGASVNACSTTGRQPIHSAAFWNRPALLKAMIAAGANVNATDGAGMRPIDLARKNKSVEIVNILLAAGAMP